MEQAMSEYVDELLTSGSLERNRLSELLKYRNLETTSLLFDRAAKLRDQVYQNHITVLGRIMISNFCKNECKMCGIRRDNRFVQRFRLSEEELFHYIEDFYRKGVRNIFLESGEDSWFTTDLVAEMIQKIKKKFSGVHLYLSFGERKRTAFESWKVAGAEGYLLSHGSENEQHFKKIFPFNTSPLLKKQGLWELKEIGYQVGDHILLGTPYQMLEHVIDDLYFLKILRPEFLSVGTFLPVPKSVFAGERSGNGEMALYLIAILRLMLPDCHIYAEPSIDCVYSGGRLTAFDAGADILMADVFDGHLLEQYGVYERKHRKLSLPADDLDAFVRQLETRGFRVI